MSIPERGKEIGFEVDTEHGKATIIRAVIDGELFQCQGMPQKALTNRFGEKFVAKYPNGTEILVCLHGR